MADGTIHSYPCSSVATVFGDHALQARYAGMPSKMIPKVTPVFSGSVQSAFAIIPIDASRNKMGTIG